jgi:hypothetical protein
MKTIFKKSFAGDLKKRKNDNAGPHPDNGGHDPEPHSTQTNLTL